MINDYLWLNSSQLINRYQPQFFLCLTRVKPMEGHTVSSLLKIAEREQMYPRPRMVSFHRINVPSEANRPSEANST